MDSYASVNKSKFGIHVDEWGPQPITIDLAGTFGWGLKETENGRMTGKQSAWFFANLNQERNRHIEDDRSDPEDFLVTFIDTKDGFICDCVCPHLAYSQDKSSPSLYRYQMHLIAVHVKRLFQGLATGDVPGISGSATPPTLRSINTNPPVGINPFATPLATAGTTVHTLAVTPGQSLNEVSRLLYGSTDAAYLQSLSTLNSLVPQAANAPLGVIAITYADPSTIVAPRTVAA